MITEKDVIDAWLYWRKIGLIPPAVKSKAEFINHVKVMHKHFAKTAKHVFKVAVIAAGKGNHRWPTMLDIELAIKLQEDV